jgi:hypothetical protein
MDPLTSLKVFVIAVMSFTLVAAFPPIHLGNSAEHALSSLPTSNA